MNQNQAVREQFHGRKLPPRVIENTVDCLSLANSPIQLPQPVSVPNSDEGIRRNISGQLLAVRGDAEIPVEGALIEIHAVTPLKQVVNLLPKAVLAHCRTLLLETVKPIDLYHASKHVADKPLLSFADVQLLREIPGYELLTTAAKSQADATLKRLLHSNPTIAKLLLSYYHHASFSSMHLTNTMTDGAGFFQCALWEPRNPDDKPGYLFTARHRISRHLYVTLYNPTPLTWYTHWDLPHGKIVTLHTRHPMAYSCNL